MYQDSLLHPRPAWVPNALAALARHELLAAHQLAAHLAVAEVDLSDGLDTLAAEGLLRRLIPSARPGEDPRPIYALTRSGAALLAAQTGQEPVSVPTLRRTLHHLRHESERADLGLLLERVHEAGTIRLLRFETRAAVIGDATLVLVRGLLRRVPLVADALAVVEVEGRVSALLVELDRGTVSLKRMRLKLAGYHNWWKCGGPERRFGLTALRVLILCPNAARMRALHTAAIEGADARGSRFVWLALAEHYVPARPEALFEPHALVALRGAEPTPLFRAST